MRVAGPKRKKGGEPTKEKIKIKKRGVIFFNGED